MDVHLFFLVYKNNIVFLHFAIPQPLEERGFLCLF